MVGAIRAHDGKPLVVAAGGDHSRAEMLAELHGGEPDAARGTMH